MSKVTHISEIIDEKIEDLVKVAGEFNRSVVEETVNQIAPKPHPQWERLLEIAEDAERIEVTVGMITRKKDNTLVASVQDFEVSYEQLERMMAHAPIIETEDMRV